MSIPSLESDETGFFCLRIATDDSGYRDVIWKKLSVTLGRSNTKGKKTVKNVRG